MKNHILRSRDGGLTSESIRLVLERWKHDDEWNGIPDAWGEVREQYRHMDGFQCHDARVEARLGTEHWEEIPWQDRHAYKNLW